MSEQTQRKNLVFQPLVGYPPEISAWLWALEDGRARTKETLTGIPPTALDFITPSIDNTIGTLLYHIAIVEADWLYEEVLVSEFAPNILALFPHDMRDATGRLSEISGVTLNEHLDRLDAVRAALLAAFRSITLEDFKRPRNLPQYYVMPQWVLHHLCQHEAEHRGQIMEARRLAEQAASSA